MVPSGIVTILIGRWFVLTGRCSFRFWLHKDGALVAERQGAAGFSN
jgi:hypothetical protein